MTFKMSVWSLYIFGIIITIALSQYIDDVDYNNIDNYDDFLPDYKLNDKLYDKESHNDFYISDVIINTENSINIPEIIIESRNIVEKVYRYTKHRIPGYDYDEFDFNYDNNAKRCDDKSIWTHCLCQFTCHKPNTVDCYTPCNNGCECKEDYVFDESTRQCVYPEYCQYNDDNNIL